MDLTFPIFAISFWAYSIYENIKIEKKGKDVEITDIVRCFLTLLFAIIFTIIS